MWKWEILASAKNGASSDSTATSAACVCGSRSGVARAATVRNASNARCVVLGSLCFSSHSARAKGRSHFAAASSARNAEENATGGAEIPEAEPSLLLLVAAAAALGSTAASRETHAARRSEGPLITAADHTSPTACTKSFLDRNAFFAICVFCPESVGRDSARRAARSSSP